MCVCGHFPAAHYADTGPCEHIGDRGDGKYWYDCKCPRYQEGS